MLEWAGPARDIPQDLLAGEDGKQLGQQERRRVHGNGAFFLRVVRLRKKTNVGTCGLRIGQKAQQMWLCNAATGMGTRPPARRSSCRSWVRIKLVGVNWGWRSDPVAQCNVAACAFQDERHPVARERREAISESPLAACDTHQEALGDERQQEDVEEVVGQH